MLNLAPHDLICHRLFNKEEASEEKPLLMDLDSC